VAGPHRRARLPGSGDARRLEQLARPLIDRTLAAVRKVLRDAKVSRDEVQWRGHGRRQHTHAAGAHARWANCSAARC
jgi:hypothetical protein